MAVYSGDPKCAVPGTYPRIRPDARDPAGRFIRERDGKNVDSTEKQGEGNG